MVRINGDSFRELYDQTLTNFKEITENERVRLLNSTITVSNEDIDPCSSVLIVEYHKVFAYEGCSFKNKISTQNLVQSIN